MADLNDLFETFPDYDVFSGKTVQNNNSQPLRQEPNGLYEPSFPERDPEDYGDGFGVISEKKLRRSNVSTIFFFPAVILWLEVFLRLGCYESFSPASVFYTVMFSIPIASVLTVICTFGSRKLNFVLANFFVLILCGLFLYQYFYFNRFRTFATFSATGGGSLKLGYCFVTISERPLFFAALVLPFVFTLLAGWFVFPFKKIRIPAKVTLVLIAVLFQIIAATTISFSKDSSSKASSYSIYHSELRAVEAQERFGLLTMERLDIF